MSNTTVYPPPENPSNLGRGPMIMGITWTFCGLAVITTLLRLYVRKRIGPKIAIDDWLMLAAMILELIAQIFITVAFTYGMGKHQADLYLPDQLINMQKWEWYQVPPGLLSAILGRISICILLTRLFGVHKWFRWFAYSLTAFGVTIAAITTVCIFAQVDPVQGLWDPFLPNITTWNPHIVQDLMFIMQASYAFADLAFVIIPIYIIWGLKMDLNRRLGLIGLVAMSLFLCAMSIMKGVTAVDSIGGGDATYAATLSLLWALLEQSCVILLGNVVPLRPLVTLGGPFIQAITASLASLINRTSWSTRGSTGSKSSGRRNAAYEDLEMKAGTVHAISPSEDSIKSLVDGRVRRTDEFDVVYSNADVSAK